MSEGIKWTSEFEQLCICYVNSKVTIFFKKSLCKLVILIYLVDIALQRNLFRGKWYNFNLLKINCVNYFFKLITLYGIENTKIENLDRQIIFTLRCFHNIETFIIDVLFWLRMSNRFRFFWSLKYEIELSIMFGGSC